MIDMIDLNAIWFVLVGVLFAGYAVLDGFDLGVGVLSLFARDAREVRLHINAIGPVWDGNEVWLVTGGGALFAAFPPVYATVFSGFYIALMLLLTALIFRAVALEFYGQVDSDRWRTPWRWAFGLCSLLIAVLFGVAFGNIIRGVPINAEGMFTGSFLGLLNPYAIAVGVLSLLLLTMHGALYMAGKTDGDLQRRMRRRAAILWPLVVVLYVAVTLATAKVSPFLFDGWSGRWTVWLMLGLLATGLIGVPVMLAMGRNGLAFVGSSLATACMVGVAGVSLFPTLVPSRTDLAFSLTAYNASSSPRTLGVMAIIAGVGMPLVIAYTSYVYWTFRGKTTAEAHGY